MFAIPSRLQTRALFFPAISERARNFGDVTACGRGPWRYITVPYGGINKISRIVQQMNVPSKAGV